MRILNLALFLTALLAFGCGGENQAAEKPDDYAPAKGSGAGTMAASVYDVVCGCAIDSIGKCGEYIVVDGKHLVLTGDLGLGDMPFCKKDGLKAKVEGKVEDGKFVATSFEYVQ